MKNQLRILSGIVLLLATYVQSYAQLTPIQQGCNVTAQDTYIVTGLNENLIFGSTPILSPAPGIITKLGVTTFEVTLKSGVKIFLPGTLRPDGVVQAEYVVSCKNPVKSVVFHVSAKNNHTGETCSDSQYTYVGAVCSKDDGVGKVPGHKPKGKIPSQPGVRPVN